MKNKSETKFGKTRTSPTQALGVLSTLERRESSQAAGVDTLMVRSHVPKRRLKVTRKFGKHVYDAVLAVLDLLVPSVKLERSAKMRCFC